MTLLIALHITDLENLQVEFKVNNARQNYAMKLGEGGEAFFVFETSDTIPESMQTSPVISPAASPQSLPGHDIIPPSSLQEPEYLDLNTNDRANPKGGASGYQRPRISEISRAESDFGISSAICNDLSITDTSRCSYSHIHQPWIRSWWSCERRSCGSPTYSQANKAICFRRIPADICASMRQLISGAF